MQPEIYAQLPPVEHQIKTRKNSKVGFQLVQDEVSMNTQITSNIQDIYENNVNTYRYKTKILS